MAPDERRRSEQLRERRRDENSAQHDRLRDDDPAQNALGAVNAAQRAARAVQRLTGRDPESVISVEQAENGWQVGVEVVEAHRIPDSADILATYQTELDGAGRLKSYRRTARYPRGTTREE